MTWFNYKVRNQLINQHIIEIWNLSANLTLFRRYKNNDANGFKGRSKW